VYDELHVYKGRQGADVSLLNRRIKACAKNKDIICIGTSATMATGSIEEQKHAVTKVASRFFDTPFEPDNVIVETLTYSTTDKQPSKEELKACIEEDIKDKSKSALIANPLAIWLERTIALRTEGEHKRRNEPQTLESISNALSSATGVNVNQCEKKIIDVLTWAEAINVQNAKERKKDTVLPFKLHQFISQTGYVYVTLDNPEKRHITLDPNPFVKIEGVEVPVYQTVF